MKILHTGDWHLGDRLNHIDRTEDLRRAVERVAAYCQEWDVDVLLVAGDLFSERSRADNLRDAVGHLHATFRPFLDRGGAVVALTGNHDNETFCRTLVHAMSLAAPAPLQPGALAANGRFYLAAGPTFFRLRARAGQEVQFVLMPYPTEHRYLTEESQQYNNLEEKHRALQAAYTRALHDIRRHPAFDARLPAVLSAHVHVKGSRLASLFRITEQEDILFDPDELASGWAYVALGHIHHPQHLPGLPHVRYCGSIERLDLGELRDDKSVVLVDVGPEGLRGQPEILPLEATPFLDVVIADWKEELPRLRDAYPEGTPALVRCHIDYQAGEDLNSVLREIRTLFPRCYHVQWNDRSLALRETQAPHEAQASMRDAVLTYLNAQLAEHQDREAVVQLAEKLLLEEAR
jgi:exonuclease SbcD